MQNANFLKDKRGASNYNPPSHWGIKTHYQAFIKLQDRLIKLHQGMNPDAHNVHFQVYLKL